MEWSDVFGCSKRHEDPGCLDEMYGFPCVLVVYSEKRNRREVGYNNIYGVALKTRGRCRPVMSS
eukprot:scaffold2409_cov230-Alexandrium_tamarense.AAC.5